MATQGIHFLHFRLVYAVPNVPSLPHKTGTKNGTEDELGCALHAQPGWAPSVLSAQGHGVLQHPHSPLLPLLDSPPTGTAPTPSLCYLVAAT